MLSALGKTFSSPRAALFKANPWLGADAEALVRAFAIPGGEPAPAVTAARRCNGTALR